MSTTLLGQLHDAERLINRLRAELADPPGDVQEKVIKMLNLVSADAITALQVQNGELQARLEVATQRAEKAEGERDAMSAILILADGYCLACGGTGGHSEGCQGTTGMVALAKQNEILRADLAAIQQEEARRIRHLNRIGTWAQQDPTGPLCPGGIQAWVLAELKGALGAAYEPTAWQPETVSQERLMAVTTSGDEVTPEVAELIAQLRADWNRGLVTIGDLTETAERMKDEIDQLRADKEMWQNIATNVKQMRIDCEKERDAQTQRAEKAELALSALRDHCATLEHADEMWQEHMSPFSDSEGDEAPWITMKREFEQLRDEKDAMEQNISDLLAANDESDHVIQQLRADLEATKADSERRRVDVLRWVKRSDEAHKACAEMRALLQIWKDNDGYEAVGNSSHLVDGTEHALSTDFGKGWVSPEKLKELLGPTIETLKVCAVALSGSYDAQDCPADGSSRVEKAIKPTIDELDRLQSIIEVKAH